ncbi:MAG: Omp28-related outer membrane protein [Saprospiraceae bacterium]
MKRVLLLTILSGFFTFSNGQAKRYIFLEHVTNSNCSVCASSNPGFYSVLTPYEGKYHHLTIHPKFPYTSCVFYQANKTENDERTNNLGVTSTPTVVINGLSKKAASQIKAATIEAELNKTSPVEIVVKEIGTNTRTVNVDVKTVGIKPTSTYRVFAVIAEKVRNQTTGNGEKIHYDVFRKFLTAVSGDPINLADNGSTVSLSYNYTVSSSWVENETYVLVWIQDVTTKEVLNSGNKFDVTTSTTDLIASDVKVLTNPVRTDLSVQLSRPLDGAYYILNIMGQVIEHGIISSFNNRFDLPVSSYKSGMYFLRIESNGQKITKRWIKESYNP